MRDTEAWAPSIGTHMPVLKTTVDMFAGIHTPHAVRMERTQHSMPAHLTSQPLTKSVHCLLGHLGAALAEALLGGEGDVVPQRVLLHLLAPSGGRGGCGVGVDLCGNRGGPSVGIGPRAWGRRVSVAGIASQARVWRKHKRSFRTKRERGTKQRCDKNTSNGDAVPYADLRREPPATTVTDRLCHDGSGGGGAVLSQRLDGSSAPGLRKRRG